MNNPRIITDPASVGLPVTPSILANIIANWNSDQQALLLSELANTISDWEKPYCFQLQHLTDSSYLTKEARALMKTIGDYSQQDPSHA